HLGDQSVRGPIAEGLAGGALAPPLLKRLGQDVGELGGAHARLVDLGEPGAFEAPADVDVVEPEAAPDDADLRRGRARAGLRAAAHADPDALVAVAALLKLADDVGQVALGLGHRQPAGRQRWAGHGIAPQWAERLAADQ